MKEKIKIMLGLGALFMLLCLALLVSPLLMPGEASIFTAAEVEEPAYAAIVFGAGLNRNGRPSDILADRLETAAQLYFAGKVQKILVSGDNTYENYDEPTAMLEFLIQWGVPAEDIAADFAGRRTYDTCARAHEIWGLEDALLVTQEFHLPRALFLCRHFGIESRGVSANQQAYIHEDYYRLREVLATYKAVLDVFLLHPKYIGGESEAL
jgi:SanA protein